MSGFFSEAAINQEKPAGLVPKCGACGIYKDCENPKMSPQGEGKKGVLIVGDYPSEDDDEANELMTGEAGDLLRDALGDIGVDLDRDAWVTNSLICAPPCRDKVETKQIGYCRPSLVATYSALRPRVVVTLGRFPLVSMLQGKWRSVDMLDKWVGWRIPFEEYWLCPTYHPKFVRHQKNELVRKQFKKDLKRAFAIERLAPPQTDYKAHVEILYDEEEIYEALKEMNQSEWVAFDYETNCLKPDYPKAKIYSCAVSNGERTISYLWKGKAVDVTGYFLRSKKTLKIASNLKMEEKWTRMEFGHGVSNWGWDTMIAAHCLDNRPGICSIKFQALVKLGVPSYNELIEPYLRGAGWYNRIHHIPIKDLLHYGGMDAILEYRVAMRQRKEMGY